MDAAIQLHRVACLMATNLDVLDQYALSLQGTVSKMLEMGLDSRVRRASVQIEAMGLWQPSLDPVMMP